MKTILRGSNKTLFLIAFICLGFCAESLCTMHFSESLETDLPVREMVRPIEIQDSLRKQKRALAKQNLLDQNSKNFTVENSFFRSRNTLNLTTAANNKKTVDTNQPTAENNTDFCMSAEDPLTSALLTFSWNVVISIGLAPVGFIAVFVRDGLKRGCKCSEKIAPVQEYTGPSIPLQVVMTKQEDDPSIVPESTASRTEVLKRKFGVSEYYLVAASLLYNIGYRGVFVFIQIKNRNYVNPSLFAIDVSMAIYFGIKKMYCPGCLYNDMHVLIYKRKFVNVRMSSSILIVSSFDARFSILYPPIYANEEA